MTTMFKATFFPGNEVRLVQCRLLERRAAPETYQDDSDDGGPPDESCSCPRSLDSRSEFIPPPISKPGYGGLPRQSRFTRYAKRRLSRAGGVMDEVAPMGESLFMTGTLPGGTDAAKETIARWSAWIVLELKKWIFKREKSAWSFYCWEWQKRGALHLHYAVWVKGAAARESIRRGFHSFWCNVMRRVGRRADCDVFARADGGSWAGNDDVVQADCQVVTKSVGRYLAKYLSKARSGGPGSGLYSPSRWFGISRHLSSEIAARTDEFECRFTDESRSRRFAEQMHSIQQSCEGLRYEWRDKSGMAKVVLLFPDSASEYQSFKKEVQAMVDQRSSNAVNPVTNSRLLWKYFNALKGGVQGFLPYMMRSAPHRVRWLNDLSPEDGVTTADFVVLTRWLMTCLAGFSPRRVPAPLSKLDAEVSEYLLLCLARFKAYSDPYRLASPWIAPSPVHVRHKRSQVRRQWRDTPPSAV